MKDLHELFTIEELSPEQAKALAAIVKESQSTKENGGQLAPQISTWTTITLTVLLALTIIAVSGIAAYYIALDERVTKIESDQKSLFGKLDAIRRKSKLEQ